MNLYYNWPWCHTSITSHGSSVYYHKTWQAPSISAATPSHHLNLMVHPAAYHRKQSHTIVPYHRTIVPYHHTIAPYHRTIAPYHRTVPLHHLHRTIAPSHQASYVPDLFRFFQNAVTPILNLDKLCIPMAPSPHNLWIAAAEGWLMAGFNPSVIKSDPRDNISIDLPIFYIWHG